MEEGTGGAGDAVGFHRNIGEGAGSDDVARSVLHVHRDGYMLRGLCQQDIDSEKSSSAEAFVVVLKASMLSESKTASEMRFMPAAEGALMDREQREDA